MINKKIKYYKKRVDFIKRRINKTKNDKHKVMLLEELSNLVKIRNMYI